MCGVLCQHPGCWKKVADIHQVPAEYLKYLTELANRRKMYESKKYPSRGRCAIIRNNLLIIIVFMLDLHERSYTADGLPILNIQTLNQDHICEHKRNRTSPLTFQHNYKPKKHSLLRPEIRYVEMALEKDEEPQIYDNQCMDVTFKPVLIWKPGYKTSQSPSRHLNTTNDAAVPGTPPTPHCGNVAGRSSLMMRTSNLTETLPPQIKTPPRKVKGYSHKEPSL